jgi:hypothetical protein
VVWPVCAGSEGDPGEEIERCNCPKGFATPRDRDAR